MRQDDGTRRDFSQSEEAQGVFVAAGAEVAIQVFAGDEFRQPETNAEPAQSTGHTMKVCMVEMND